MSLHRTTDHRVSIQTTSFEKTASSVAKYEVTCTLWGDCSKPLLVILGGISSNRWALNHQQSNHVGWWSRVINQQSHLNSNDFCFLTFDYFIYPQQIINPPIISTSDQANILHQIQSKLNLPQFHAVVGSSYGGMVALAFAARYPKALERLICIAAGDHNTVKSQALRLIQRQIIELGRQNSAMEHASEPTSKDEQTLQTHTALARTLAMVGYRGEDELEQRFQSSQSGKALREVAAYLQHHGNKFAQQFSVSRYVQLSQSIDFHQVDASSVEAKTQLIGISTDQMVPVKLMQKLQHKLSNAAETHLNIIDSKFGHDGFLLESKQLNQIFKIFLSEQKHDNLEPNNRRACGH